MFIQILQPYFGAYFFKIIFKKQMWVVTPMMSLRTITQGTGHFESVTI